MNDKLIDIIEEQNNYYLGTVTLIVTLALTIFGVIQWQINNKKLRQLKEQSIRESEEKIVKEYSLEKIEDLDQYQQKAKILLKNMYSQWHGNLITNIFNLIQEIGNDPKVDPFFKMDDFEMAIDAFVKDPFLNKEMTGVSLTAVLTKLEVDKFKRPDQAKKMADYVRNKGKESLQAYRDMKNKTVKELKKDKY